MSDTGVAQRDDAVEPAAPAPDTPITDDVSILTKPDTEPVQTNGGADDDIEPLLAQFDRETQKPAPEPPPGGGTVSDEDLERCSRISTASSR